MFENSGDNLTDGSQQALENTLCLAGLNKGDMAKALFGTPDFSQSTAHEYLPKLEVTHANVPTAGADLGSGMNFAAGGDVGSALNFAPGADLGFGGLISHMLNFFEALTTGPLMDLGSIFPELATQGYY